VRLRPPTLETTMQTVADRFETLNAIRTDLGAIFVSDLGYRNSGRSFTYARLNLND
jgi:hypothetical protein